MTPKVCADAAWTLVAGKFRAGPGQGALRLLLRPDRVDESGQA
jgi:hypothetical protein